MIKNERYLAFVRTQPCLLCGTPLNIVAHHRKTKKMGGGDRNDYKAVPLCGFHHVLFHGYRKDFIKQFGQKWHDYLNNKINRYDFV